MNHMPVHTLFLKNNIINGIRTAINSKGLIVQVLSLGLRRNCDISYVGYGQHNSKEASLQELKTKEWHISHRY